MKEDIKYLSISELNRIIKMKFDSSAFLIEYLLKEKYQISKYKCLVDTVILLLKMK